MSHAQNIQRTLEAMFHTKTPASGIFRKKLGMQFDRPGAKFVGLAIMFVFVGAIFAFISTQWILGAVLLVATPVLVAYVIDLRGLEIDFKNEKIRRYQSFLGMTTGEWMPLSAFDSVRVYQHQLKTQKGKFINRGPKKYDTHAYYYVRLVSPGLNTSVSLLELNNYQRAKEHAEKVARAARLRLIEKPAKLKEDRV